ncbi:hypothetical protein [Lysinibacter cavernae]|uniref:Uncharacterized protein n=1 Tax=Lysinibacter cavernae TaxID=1640652 RepID=A0A7X5R0D4_9MICO|nr:hypothetical protein [Lysinibacter cavernae]NIH53296.1 hypothetical protein [Lysinibacter cavernae]
MKPTPQIESVELPSFGTVEFNHEDTVFRIASTGGGWIVHGSEHPLARLLKTAEGYDVTRLHGTGEAHNLPSLPSALLRVVEWEG